jgi:membrane protein required for colicin V production
VLFEGVCMNWLDAVIIALFAWFTFAAFQAGFVREAVTVVAAVLGVVVAGIFYIDLADDILVFINNEQIARIVAFGALFAATALAGQMMALILKPAVDAFQLGVFDQLVGAAFGFAKALVFVEVFLVVFITYPKWGMGDTIDQSFIGPLMIKNAPVLVQVLPDEFELGVNGFKAGVPASFPDSPGYHYQPPGNVPPMLNP